MESPLPLSSVLVTDEHAAGSHPEERGDVHDGHTWPAPDISKEQPVGHNIAEQEQDAAPTQADTVDVSSAPPSEAEEQGDRQRGDPSDLTARRTPAESENDIEDGVEVHEAAPHVTPSISPLPINLRSKPTLPVSLPPIPTWSRPTDWSTTLGVRGWAVPEVHEEGGCAPGDAYAASDLDHQVEDGQEDEVSARHRATTERMGRPDGLRPGTPPPMNPSRPSLRTAAPPTSVTPDEIELEAKEGEPPEEEGVRKQWGAGKLADMGDMQPETLVPAAEIPASTRHLVAKQEVNEGEDTVPPVPVSAPPRRRPPTRKPPPPVEHASEAQSAEKRRGTSDSSVQGEAESQMEQIRHENAEAQMVSEKDVPAQRGWQMPSSANVLPNSPPLAASRSLPLGRHSIAAGWAPSLGQWPSATARPVSLLNSRQTLSPLGKVPVMRPQSRHVVEAEDPDENNTPVPSPPRSKTSRGAVRSMLLPRSSPNDPLEALTNVAQWRHELGEGSEITSSSWSEESTAVHVPAHVLSPDCELHPGSRNASGKGVNHDSRSGSVRSVNQAHYQYPYKQQNQQRELTSEELMVIWHKFGTHVVTAVAMLFEKSKHTLVGDGSYAGFVRTVLAEVPGIVSHPGDEWGYVVYTQTGTTVHRRVSDIRPGDVITFVDARLKGQKGLSTYTRTLGKGEPLVGIVSAFNGKKTRVSVWQANQHVGLQTNSPIFQWLTRGKNSEATQTVENVSYRLEDLKSGQVKVSRCTFFLV